MVLIAINAEKAKRAQVATGLVAITNATGTFALTVKTK
jgi:hypothetical protein